jgi:hypothetical protein
MKKPESSEGKQRSLRQREIKPREPESKAETPPPRKRLTRRDTEVPSLVKEPMETELSELMFLLTESELPKVRQHFNSQFEPRSRNITSPQRSVD